MHHGLGVLVWEAESVAEEERAHERQLLELLQRDGVSQQLPLGLQREKLVDELLRVRQEVVVVVLVPGERDNPREGCPALFGQRLGKWVRFCLLSNGRKGEQLRSAVNSTKAVNYLLTELSTPFSSNWTISNQGRYFSLRYFALTKRKAGASPPFPECQLLAYPEWDGS